tara:strand:- start:638 stop:1447 length:810 start_codon:yes stop_codon:yes gene_type:complete
MLSTLFFAVFAGLVAILVTVAIEKWGGIIGGILGTVPTTIIPAAAGIMLEGDNLSVALAIVPLGMLLNGIFLGVWVVLPNRYSTNLVMTLVSALTLWTILGVGMVFVTDALLENWQPFEIGLAGLLVLLALGVKFTWSPENTPSGSNTVGLTVLISRGLAAAIAIGIAVQLAGMGYPLVAGLASVFPAIFLTSMVALWLAQGSEVPIGAAGPMMLGGASVSVYALVAMWSLPEYGLLIGSVISWIVAVVCWSTPAYYWLNWRKQQIVID